MSLAQKRKRQKDGPPAGTSVLPRQGRPRPRHAGSPKRTAVPEGSWAARRHRIATRPRDVDEVSQRRVRLGDCSPTPLMHALAGAPAVVMFGWSPLADPKEQVNKWKKDMRSESRKLDRQILSELSSRPRRNCNVSVARGRLASFSALRAPLVRTHTRAPDSRDHAWPPHFVH